MKRFLIFLVLASIVCTSNVYAQIAYYFNGTESSLWSDARNWYDGMKPNDTDIPIYICADVYVDEDAIAGKIFFSDTSLVMTIATGCYLQAFYIDLVSANHLILEHGASLYCDSEVPATVQQRILPGSNRDVAAWHLISSPVDESLRPNEVDNLLYNNDQYELYRLNARNTTSIWERYRDEAYQESFYLDNGHGYLYAVGDTVTLQYHGTMSAAAQPIAVDLDYAGVASLPYDGWNLVGNPFICESYADRSYYRMNAVGNNLELVRASAGHPIKPCMGVLTQATDAGQSVTFYPLYTSSPADYGAIHIVLTDNNNDFVDEFYISFSESDELGLFNFTEKKGFVFLHRDGANYSIISTNPSCETPLHFKAKENGNFTLTFVPENADIRSLWLVDNITGADVDLLVNPSYTFNATINDYASRFKLFVNTNHGISEHGESQPFAYFNNGNIVIPKMGTAGHLQILDMAGRVVMETMVGCQAEIPFTASTGVYVLRFVTDSGVLTQKIVLR